MFELEKNFMPMDAISPDQTEAPYGFCPPLKGWLGGTARTNQ